MTEDEHEGQTVSRVIMARALIDFFVVRVRTREAWADIKELREFEIDHFSEQGWHDMVGMSEDNLQRIPFRERQWAKALKEWRVLCENALSDEALICWYRGSTNCSDPS